VILGLGGVSIAMVIDLVVYVICPPLLRQPRRTSSLSGTSRFRKGHVMGTSFSRFRRSESGMSAPATTSSAALPKENPIIACQGAASDSLLQPER
jgi:hypothetical protein